MQPWWKQLSPNDSSQIASGVTGAFQGRTRAEAAVTASGKDHDKWDRRLQFNVGREGLWAMGLKVEVFQSFSLAPVGKNANILVSAQVLRGLT